MAANLRAFLDMIAVSEIGKALLERSDNGYNVLVGSTAAAPHLFPSYADHPRFLVYLPHLKVNSTAAGRYQILEHTFDAYRIRMHLPDFSPQSQDAIATQLIRERKALAMIEEGDFSAAVHACSNLWASLPGAGYLQHENRIADLRAAFVAAGGTTTSEA